MSIDIENATLDEAFAFADAVCKEHRARLAVYLSYDGRPCAVFTVWEGGSGKYEVVDNTVARAVALAGSLLVQNLSQHQD
jgi:hypothetical protein